MNARIAASETVEIVVGIHGILTGRSEPTWPERLETRLARTRPQARTLTDHYRAGPMPRLNWFYRNPKSGRQIARWVAHWVESYPRAKVYFVAHSNGCDVARRAIRELDSEYRITTEAAVLVSAPLPATTRGMGLDTLIETGRLKRLVTYSSNGDIVLGKPPTLLTPWRYLGRAIRWPYGNLGTIGLQDALQELKAHTGHVTARTANRAFDRYRHGDFFPKGDPVKMNATFETIEKDLFR